VVDLPNKEMFIKHVGVKGNHFISLGDSRVHNIRVTSSWYIATAALDNINLEIWLSCKVKPYM